MTRETASAQGGPTTNLADLVDYQTGSVVSRTILKRPGGSVTIFAFDAGQELSEHSTPHDALVHILDGEVEITVGGRANHLVTGNWLHLPANDPHAVRATSRFKMVLTMLRTTG